MGQFLEAEKLRQAAFKATSPHFSETARAEGFYKGKWYPFCLPQERAEENLFREIRTAALLEAPLAELARLLDAVASQLRSQALQGEPCIYQGAQDHVAAGARETV